MKFSNYLIIALTLVILWPSLVIAQEGVSLSQLQGRLTLLKSELAKEQQVILQRKGPQENDLKQLRSKRKELADQLLNDQIEHLKNKVLLAELRNEGLQITADAEVLANQINKLPFALTEALELLRLHLRERPESENQTDEIRSLASEIVQTPKVLIKILSKLNAVQQNAMQVSIQPMSIYTASGNLQEVNLLTLWHVRFVYETLDGKQMGLALSSPREALKAELANAFQVVSSGSNSSRLASFPLDTIGKIHDGGPVMYPLGVLLLIAFRF